MRSVHARAEKQSSVTPWTRLHGRAKNQEKGDVIGGNARYFLRKIWRGYETFWPKELRYMP